MNELVHPKEKLYFAISLMVSLAVYALLAFWAVQSIETFLGFAFYGLMFGLLAFVAHGLFIGHVRGNGVRVSEKQLPDVYRAAQQVAAQMGLQPMPAIYVMQAGGLLNAFATRFLRRNFVIVYSDVMELAYDKGEAEVGFVLCHEFAHVKRKHLSRRLLLLPSTLIPFLAAAYSRACEYTCDRFGAHFVPAGAVNGILVLASGKRLYRMLDAEQFSEQVNSDRGFWIWYAELLSTHPRLSKRVRSLRERLAGDRAGPQAAGPAMAD